MGIDDKGKETPGKKILRLGTQQLARAALCKFITLRYNNKIDSQMFKDMVNGLSNLLCFDKQTHEIDKDKKLDLLLSFVNESGKTAIDQSLIENPYAAGLKQQLGNEQKINSELNSELLNLKRELARYKAESGGETD
jgi:hypothetical protein